MIKPKDFRIPFTWDNRTVTIKDRTWFFPPQTVVGSFVFPGWESNDLFGNTHPVYIEYCSGNGSWIIDKAQQMPHINWLAVEKRYDRARKIWAKAKNYSLNNLVIVLGEAEALTKSFIPALSVDQTFINFPDPWPKRRHAKHRLVSTSFVAELARILKPQGEATLVTDDEEYSTHSIKYFLENPQFSSLYEPPYYQEIPESYGTSFFESLFRGFGKKIRMHTFQKSAS